MYPPCHLSFVWVPPLALDSHTPTYYAKLHFASNMKHQILGCGVMPLPQQPPSLHRTYKRETFHHIVKGGEPERRVLDRMCLDVLEAFITLRLLTSLQPMVCRLFWVRGARGFSGG